MADLSKLQRAMALKGPKEQYQVVYTRTQRIQVLVDAVDSDHAKEQAKTYYDAGHGQIVQVIEEGEVVQKT